MILVIGLVAAATLVNAIYAATGVRFRSNATGMEVGLALALVLVVIGEIMAGSDGLAAQIINMERSFWITRMYARVAILATVNLSLTMLFNAIEDRLVFGTMRIVEPAMYKFSP